MHNRLLTSQRFLVLAALTALTGTAVAQTTRAQHAPQPSELPHCKLLEQLTPKQREAHLMSGEYYTGAVQRPSLEVVLEAYEINENIPTHDAINREFHKSNPEWAKEWSDAIDRVPATQMPTLNKLWQKNVREMHRQCFPGIS